MDSELLNNSHPFAVYIAAPSVRKAAREQCIDLKNVKGSGRYGRILHTDLYQDKHSIPSEEIVVPFPTKVEESTAYRTIPFKGLRKRIAENMVRSVQTIPHVNHYEEIDLTNLMAFRKKLQASEKRISVVPFFLKALAVALREFPVFNAQLNEQKDQIELFKYVNIGLATDTNEGLVVPVLKQVENKSLVAIQADMKALTKKAQVGKLKKSERSEGTFTISNVGPLGGVRATPIINHPQTGIMAFHKIKSVPVDYQDGAYQIKSMMNISFAFDHRVADGADSIKFTNRFKELLEQPEKLMIYM